MKFTPHQLKENVNISKTHPLKEFFVLLGGIFGILFIIYLTLGFTLDILVERIPTGFEEKLANFFSERFLWGKSPSEAEKKAQKIVDELSNYIPQKSFTFRVHIAKDPQVNAVALPAGHIVIYTGLLKKIESENELTMVLAHELGHYIHRDHLRGLGRGLVLMLISSFIFGIDSKATEFFIRMLLTADLRFSRRQEMAADKFALELLNKKYSHVAGAVDLFEHLCKKKGDIPAFFKLLLTHPSYSDRINFIKEQIDTHKYEIREKIPLNPVFRTLLEEKGVENRKEG